MKYKRFVLTLVPLVMLIVPFNNLYAKKQTYWDYFRDPVKKRTSWYDIEFSLACAGPLGGDISRETAVGPGFTLGFHYQKKFFRAGLVLGYSFFPGMSGGDDDRSRTNFFVSAPLYCDIAFDIRLARVFSLVPFLSLGFSIDAVGVTRNNSPSPDDDEDIVLAAMHQAQRLGLGFWFHLTQNYSLVINAAYAPLIEYGDRVVVVHLAQLSLGFARRF